MSWILRQAVAKRVLDRHLDEIDKEMHARETVNQKDLNDLKFEISNQERQREDTLVQGLRLGNGRFPPVKSARVKRNKPKEHQPTGNRLSTHRHSVDVADLPMKRRAEFEGIAIQRDRDHQKNEDSGVINDMEYILNQSRERSSKTPEEMCMERYKDKLHLDDKRRSENADTFRSESPASDNSSSNRSSYILLKDSRKNSPDPNWRSIPQLNLEDINSQNIRVSFVEDGDTRTKGEKDDSENGSEETQYYSLRDTDGAWTAARKARYLRGYDPPEMILPAGDSGSFVFGRNFNEALVSQNKSDHC